MITTYFFSKRLADYSVSGRMALKFTLTSLMQAHIDWRSIKENLEAVKANVANRNSRADPDKVVKLYDDWRELQNAAEQLRSDRNANAKAMKVPASS